jgi:glycosyltransferase involved in cell wall biosynthesis
MALGVPTLSTSVGGVGDAVVDGETGLLVPPDDAEGLAKALKRLLDDRPLRLRLAASARAWAEATCTEETMIARYVELYVRAVSRRRRGRRHETAAASER